MAYKQTASNAQTIDRMRCAQATQLIAGYTSQWLCATSARATWVAQWPRSLRSLFFSLFALALLRLSSRILPLKINCDCICPLFQTNPTAFNWPRSQILDRLEKRNELFIDLHEKSTHRSSARTRARQKRYCQAHFNETTNAKNEWCSNLDKSLLDWELHQADGSIHWVSVLGIAIILAFDRVTTILHQLDLDHFAARPQWSAKKLVHASFAENACITFAETNGARCLLFTCARTSTMRVRQLFKTAELHILLISLYDMPLD